jgi:hypothetical protein
MAVISSLDLEDWRMKLAPDLDRELRGALARVFPDRGDVERKSVLGFGGRKKKATAVVILDRIDDNGTAGGVRADCAGDDRGWHDRSRDRSRRPGGAGARAGHERRPRVGLLLVHGSRPQRASRGWGVD